MMSTELDSFIHTRDPSPSSADPTTKRPEIAEYLQTLGKDASRLIFEDELTGIRNRRFMLRYLDTEVAWDDPQLLISILVIDLDKFKGVNDEFGHAVGDSLLCWLSGLLHEAAGDRGTAVRYGGDEFVLLLPGTNRQEALRTANAIMQRARDRKFRVRGTEKVFRAGVSIGVASAPEDARTAKDLFNAGDTALYHAKQSGRGQLADAAAIDLGKVFSRTALHRLKASGISGRDAELDVVSKWLEQLSTGQSSFVTVEAAAGFGKTAFLETIADNLANSDSFHLVRVAGVAQEAFRAYYLATAILVELLKGRQIEGGIDLQDLSEQEIDSLAHLVPQLRLDTGREMDVDDKNARGIIFRTLTQCIPKLAGARPLVFLIDDLQFADDATLYLLGALLQKTDVDVLVCGTYMESFGLGGAAETTPLSRFLTRYERELVPRRISLSPLDREAIVDHLNGVFPNLKMPAGFDADLEEITLGNPLFIAEIIRKLVREDKARLVGQEWVIQPLPDDYLPQSLEEVVGEMIAALDVESRRLLEQASALGEDVPVSVLTGSSDVDENRVLQFLDRAESLGLVELNFQVNDEIMRFLGKRVMEISYGTIDEDRRKELHERVANYQEGLFEDRLIPSASLLAYHFKRSANQEKARRYQEMQVHYGHSVFDEDEAAGYIGFPTEAGLQPGEALGEAGLGLMPDVLRGLLTAVRSVQLYPKDSDAVGSAGLQFKQAVETILRDTGRLSLTLSEDGGLQLNGEPADLTKLGNVAASFVELLRRSQLQGLALLRPVDGDELLGLVDALAALDPATIERGFWRQYAAERELRTIELKQTSYSRISLEDDAGEQNAGFIEPRLEELDAADLAALPEILRTFTKTAKNVKLYPIRSDSAGVCMQEFRDALDPVLAVRPVLSLARAEDSLLANGGVVNTADFEVLAGAFLGLMDSLGLRSLAFFSGVGRLDIETLFEAIRAVPHIGVEAEFWEHFAAEKRPTGLRVNHESYSLVTAPGRYPTPPGAIGEDQWDAAPRPQGLPGAAVGPPGHTDVPAAEGSFPGGTPGPFAPPGTAGTSGYAGMATDRGNAAPGDAGAPLPDAGESVEELGKELLVDGQDDLFEQLLLKVFDEFGQRDPRVRADTFEALGNLMGQLILGLQQKFVALTGTHVIEALGEEDDPTVLQQGVSLIHAMATVALQMSDNRAAAGLYASLARYSARAHDTENSSTEDVREILDRPPDDNARRIVEADLRSGDPARLSNAALVLSGLGAAGIPVLIETIKQEKDLRTRQAAASILADMGSLGADQMKRALMLEVIVEQRFRLLEVIETVTLDLHDELSICLGDANPKIRRAAFRLAERLHHDGLAEILGPLARDEDPAVAKGALRSLTSLGTDEASGILVSVLEASKDPEIAVACCQGLGQLGGTTAVEALSRVLSRKKLLVLGPVWSDQVRATAAMVLANMTEPSAREALGRFATDRDPRVRRIAGSCDSTA